MSAEAETFVNYALIDNIWDAYKAGVITEIGDVSDEEDRHVSELERRMTALDEKEIYVTLKTLKENHWDTFVKTIKYLKEGESV